MLTNVCDALNTWLLWINHALDRTNETIGGGGLCCCQICQWMWLSDISSNIWNICGNIIFILQAKITCVTWARYNDIADYIVSGDENGVVAACNVASKETKCYSYYSSKAAITAICCCSDSANIIAAGWVCQDFKFKGKISLCANC